MEKKQFKNLYTTKNVPKRSITCGGLPSEYHITKTVAQDKESEIKTHYYKNKESRKEETEGRYGI